MYKGDMSVNIGGESFMAHQGDFVIVPSYQMHHFISTSHTDNFVLMLPPEYINKFKKITDEKYFSKLLLQSGRATKRIKYMLEFLYENTDAANDHECYDNFTTRGLIYTMLGIVLDEIPLEDRPHYSSSGPIQKILIYLNENYKTQVSLEMLSEAFGYSQSRISHMFNEYVGISIPEYLNALRTRVAASILLERETASIYDVAMEAGFNSMSTFYRGFRSCFGVTTSQFIKLPEAERRRLLHISH